MRRSAERSPVADTIHAKIRDRLGPVLRSVGTLKSDIWHRRRAGGNKDEKSLAHNQLYAMKQQSIQSYFKKKDNVNGAHLNSNSYCDYFSES